MNGHKFICIHCSATPNDRTLFSGKPGTPGYRSPDMVIDQMHKERGFHRDTYWRGRQNASLQAIGYHFVIARDGTVFTGRHLDEVPAHAAGWNQNAIAICMLGTDKFTQAQWTALKTCVEGLWQAYDIPLMPARVGPLKGQVQQKGVCGHRDLSPDKNGDGKISKNEWIKLCPGFDVATWLSGGMKPLAGHIEETA